MKKNKWAVILGGSSGLGLAAAKKLAESGYNICIIHRNSRSEMEAILPEFESVRVISEKFISLNTNAAHPDKIISAITEIKKGLDGQKIHCLLHSIAKGSLKSMISADNPLTGEDFLITLQAMAVSLYDWTKLLFLEGLFSDDARIIAFTSEGSSKAWQNYAAVSAAKAALESISRSIALEFAPFGIKSNCIQAGITDTASLRRIPQSDEILSRNITRNPSARLTTPEDIANVVAMLCSDEASWITGTVIKADGGESLQ